VLLIACAHPSPRAPAASEAPAAVAKPASIAALGASPPLATPGEHMQYKLSLKGIELATYDIALGELSDVAGKRAIVVQSHAKVTGVAAFVATIDDRFTSWIDVATGRPLRFQADEFASGSRTKVEHVVVDLAGRTENTIPVAFHVNDEPPVVEPSQQVNQPIAWDYNAFMIALRAWEGAPGTAMAAEVFRSRWIWHVDVKIVGKENLVTAMGDLPALRLEGRTYKLDRKGARDAGSAERTFTIWISDDDGRVPLRITAVTDYGDLEMQIVDYQPGTGARLRP
jgi:hypothetical protein